MAPRKYPAVIPTDCSVFTGILGLEQELLSTEARHDADRLKMLLHDGFSEVGASGRTYGRDQVISFLASETDDGSAAEVEDPIALQLADNLVMLRWSTHAVRPSQRTSLWVFEQNRWQMLFHQGTLSPAAVDPSQFESAPIATRKSIRTSAATVSLRPLRALDADAVFEAFDSDPHMHRQGDASTPAAARKYVGSLLAQHDRQYPLAITNEDRLVGLVCATIDNDNKNAWVWYWMHADFRGQSLTTRALATLSAYLFEHRGLYRLELGLRANNPGSRLVAEKNGFIREGIERGKFLIDGERMDVLTYARLRSDPAPSLEPLPFTP